MEDTKINLINLVNEINNEQMYKMNEMAPCDISELHMHKILFYVYGLFANKFDRELFDANFQTWKSGPVEVDYHNALKTNTSLEKFNVVVDENELEYLKKITKSLLETGPWMLINSTYNLLCWLYNYDYSPKFHNIPNSEIKRDFEQKVAYFDEDI